MVQFLPRQQSLGERLAGATQNAVPGLAGSLGQHYQQDKQKKEQLAMQSKEDEVLQRLLGQDVRGLSPEMKKLFLQESMKQMTAGQKLAGEGKDKMQTAQGGLQTVKRMRDLGKTGHLGFTLKPNRIAPEQAAVRGEYEQLGKSLIQLSSQIPIRNQKEFETLAAKLYDPNLSDGEREGTLNAMERIIRQSAGEDIEQVSESAKERSGGFFDIGKKPERKSLKSFMKAK